MWADTDGSPFHAWSQALPDGMLDAYRSVVPAPDHLFYNGIACDLLGACFQAISKDDRSPVLASLREALARSGLHRTSPYNARTGKVNSLSMSERAATLPVAPICFQRALSQSVTQVVGARTALRDVLQILTLFVNLERATYFAPRAGLDGVDACRRAPTLAALQDLASEFFACVDASMRRSDDEAVQLVTLIDKPNLHRLREVYFFTLPGFLLVRHVRELFYESAHQPLKRVVVKGNGHNDARAAMLRMLQTECFSRIAIEPATFNLPSHFWGHVAIVKQVKQALPLYTMKGQRWRVADSKKTDDTVSARALTVPRHHCHPDFSISWRRSASPGAGDYLRVGDTVSVLCHDFAVGASIVRVAGFEEGNEPGPTVRFFLVEAFYTNANRMAVGVVHPYASSDASLWTLDASQTMLLTLSDGVRRSLALHVCDEYCQMSSPIHTTHSANGKWPVLGRADMYPTISG